MRRGTAMDTNQIPGSTEYIVGVLEQLFRGHGVRAVRTSASRSFLRSLFRLFRGHGVRAVRSGLELLFPAFPNYRMTGEAFRATERAGQIDIRLWIAPDRMLGESVAGVGPTPAEQIPDGIRAFITHSFHVLLCAFFGVPPAHGVARERWAIGGTPRDVFVGTVGSRFGFPLDADGSPDIGFFQAFKHLLEVQSLPSGIHWVRLYQARQNGQSICNEVLLDNDPWPALQDGMAAFGWPASDKWYDVRVFLVIRDPA